MAEENSFAVTTAITSLHGMKDTELLNAGFFRRLMPLNFDPHTSGIFGVSHVGKENMALVDGMNLSLWIFAEKHSDTMKSHPKSVSLERQPFKPLSYTT
jgi:hypothetical protein